MTNGGDAAEQVVRLSLEGFEVAARLTGSAAKNVGILFWLSFIGGYTLLIITNKKFRKLFVQGNPEVESKLPNCFEFFSNTYAAVADAILIAVIVVLIVITILGRMTGVFPYIVLAILVFSINMHCLFNGNIYKTIRTNDTRERKRCKGMKDVN